MRASYFALALAFALPAAAVDHTENTVGIGLAVQSISSNHLLRPTFLSARMAFNPRLEGAVVFGARLASDNTVFSPGIKGHFILIPEKHVNLYAAVGAGADVATNGGLTTIWYQLGPGAEFFLDELPNLGLFVEFGFWGEILPSATGLNSESTYLSTGVGSAGLHYWF